MNTLNVKRMTAETRLPERANPDDAGLDIFSLIDVTIASNSLHLIPVGVGVQIERGYVGIIADKSSMGSKGLKVNGGIIDAGYTGEITVVLMNLSQNAQAIKKGQKVAQLLVLPVALPKVKEVTAFEDTARGSKGFGSSGA